MSRHSRRFLAAGLHLLVCGAVAAAAAVLVFGVWYPWPYRVVSGGQDLFLLVVSVDVVLGPLLTFTVFNVAKPRAELRRDLAVILLLQSAGLLYGLHTVYEVRPVATVFETDRFRVVTAAEVYLPELAQAPVEYRRLPLAGPWLLGAREPLPGDERNDALFMGLKGVDIGQRPKFWQPYEQSRQAALARSRPVDELIRRYPAQRTAIEEALLEKPVKLSDARFLPLMARLDWVVLMDAEGRPIGHVPLDGFF